MNEEIPWHEQPGAIGRARLRAILAGIEAPRPPLTRAQQVALLAACYRAQGYLLLDDGRPIHHAWQLDMLEELGLITPEEVGFAREVFAHLGKY